MPCTPSSSRWVTSPGTATRSGRAPPGPWICCVGPRSRPTSSSRASEPRGPRRGARGSRTARKE
eukprot:6225758-Pyramimonas_sp.AAC.1